VPSVKVSDRQLSFTTENIPLVTQSELQEMFRLRHDPLDRVGWAPRMRLRFNYFSPDEYYEAVVNKLVTANGTWLDVGCGRYVFPSNIRLARMLSKRCGLLVGVDPDPTIDENTVIHSRSKTSIEHFHTDHTFDLVTLRMVAEHIANPQAALSSLARLTKPGGKVVIYTINRWSPVPIITWITPFKSHHPIKRFLWEAEEKDTFPVSYRMNTRKELRKLFEMAGFRERHFAYLDDCRSLARFRPTLFLELSCRTVLRSLRIRYPENCLLGVYERL
jgi:2-polyprenyl-3-methyl-5-hydroxy-6-metoxy-1,4-benzoquinol methylase